jgi:PAS domain-containing protein
LNLFDRYLLSEWLKMLALLVAATMGVLLMAALYDSLRDLLQTGVGLADILRYFATLMPSYLSVVLPLSLLLSLLFVLSKLHRNNELTAMRADGTEFPVELTITRVEPPGGGGFIGFVRDISERLRAEEELRSAHRRLELIADEQGSLRRVATLVARQAKPEELLAVVAREVAHVLGVRGTCVIRYDASGTATVVGLWGDGMPFTLGTSSPVEETAVAAVIWRTRQPASVDVAGLGGSVATALLENGTSSSATTMAHDRMGKATLQAGTAGGAVAAAQRK